MHGCAWALLPSLGLQLLPQQVVSDLVTTILSSENEWIYVPETKVWQVLRSYWIAYWSVNCGMFCFWRLSNWSHTNQADLFAFEGLNGGIAITLYCWVALWGKWEQTRQVRHFQLFLACWLIYAAEVLKCNIMFYNSIRNNQQMQLYAVNFIPLLSSLHMFRAAHTPIIRSTKFNCIYSHWYNHRLA
jgi:hypothetical protein